MADERSTPPLDLRHIGRLLDKEMAVREPGMEMSKPGAPDMRRRRHSVVLPNEPADPAPENPPQTTR
jgi:hypothetical protein